MHMITTGQKIAIQKTTASRLQDTDLSDIKFGRTFSDHMFMMEYDGKEWLPPGIVPFSDLVLSPATLVFHYGQAIFEGMKAYRHANGKITLFRPQENIARMNRSAKRMCMPEIPEGLFMEALLELIKLDNGWLPTDDEAALYIRPFMFASDEYIGVKPSEHYKFIIFLCPVRKYYSDPVKVKIETHYARAFPGGVGATKCAGNYAGSLYPARLAQQQGYHQLLWTDGREHKFIEESGTMNVFFMFDDILVTPPTSGTILEGITRASLVELAKDKGIPIEVRPIAVEEIIEAAKQGRLRDAFGAGTAATLAHIESIALDGEEYQLPPIKSRAVSNMLAKAIDDIRRGRIEDRFGWNVEVPQ